MSEAPASADLPNAKPGYSRRDLLRTVGALSAAMAVGSLPEFTSTARAATAGPASARPATPSLVPAAQATTLWYTAPADEADILSEGLPIGNGRLGALVGGDPSRDFLYLTDCTLWTGGLNATLGSDGQFPYDTDDFGTFGLLAQAYLNLPAHAIAQLSDYQRQLDLSNGLVSTSYSYQSVNYQRTVYSSHPDDVVVIHLTQSGGGSYTGSLELDGTRGETTAAGATSGTAAFSGTLANGLTYAAVAAVSSATGTVSVSAGSVSFSGCEEVLIVISGGTNYSTNAASGFMNPALAPATVAQEKAVAATARPAGTLLAAHTADYQALAGAMTVDLGSSSAAQRAMDTATRLTARAAQGAPPDPELEASYLQLGRYLMITGSRSNLPVNLQGLWLSNDSPDWMSDYHLDINLEMNYWLPDRAGLSSCFDTFTDYCVNQIPSWEQTTQQLFNDSRNGFANSSGKIAGWTTAISTNPYGGLGWWWHPAGNAWLCNSLFDHYHYTQDNAHLAKIYPLLKGACQFWEARLLTTTVTDPTTGDSVQVLVDDNDWSPEQGPTNAHGITYAQELVWQLFENYGTASTLLGLDPDYRSTIAGLQAQLYLPQVSSTTGWLEEWMTPDDLGDPTHRHLSPLIGFFPGDRICYDTSPAALLTGARNLLTARGLQSFGWGMAWRALCWARFKEGETAYQLVLSVMAPSVDFSNGAGINMLDMYSLSSSSSTFQIDANFGTPAAMIEMLLYSRPGVIELLPATPEAWSAGGSATGIGARGGFTVDFTWLAGQVQSVTLHSVGGTATTVRAGAWSQDVTLTPGGSTVLTPTAYTLTNRASGKVLDVPGSSTTPGQSLIQYAAQGSANQKWQLAQLGGGLFNLVNVNSGLLVDVDGGTTAAGAAIIQWTDADSSNQQWTLTAASDGYVKLVNVRSGLLLSVAGGSLANAAGIVQEPDSGSGSQQWLLTSVSP